MSEPRVAKIGKLFCVCDDSCKYGKWYRTRKGAECHLEYVLKSTGLRKEDIRMNSTAQTDDLTFEEYIKSELCNPTSNFCDEIKTAEIYDRWEREILDLIQENGYFRRIDGCIGVDAFDFASLREIKKTRLTTARFILMTPEQRRENGMDTRGEY